MAWTSGAESAIRQMGAGESDAVGTRAYLRHCASQLEEVVGLVRREGAVGARDRKTLRSLIIVSVHAK